MSRDNNHSSVESPDVVQPPGITNDLRFTIALQNQIANYDSNYYRTQFSDSLRNSFNPVEGEVGRSYSYALSFDEFRRETKPDDWLFDVTDVRGLTSWD